MRVLLVNDYPVEHGGGAEVHLGRLAEVLRGAGDTVVVHAPPPHRGIARVLDVWDPFHRRTVRRLAEEIGADVVHVHNFQRELSASVLGAAGGVPFVVTAHDYRLLRADEGPAGARRGPVRLLKDAKARFERHRVRRTVDAVIGVSDALADELRAGGLPEVRRIDCFAVDPSGVPGPPGRDVVFVGQLIPAKGIADLVEAFVRLSPRHPEVRLRIAGSGAQEAELRRSARAIGDRVVFEGRLDDAGVRRLMAEAAIVAIPSTRTTEGTPIVAIEAMLAARPVVVTDSAPFRLLVDEGVHGVLVPIGEPAALADAIERILDDPAAGEAMGRAGFERAVERFTASVAVDRFRALYHELASPRP